MNSESNEAKGPELKPVIRLLTWFTVCYCFSLVGVESTKLGNHAGLDHPLWADRLGIVAGMDRIGCRRAKVRAKSFLHPTGVECMLALGLLRVSLDYSGNRRRRGAIGFGSVYDSLLLEDQPEVRVVYDPVRCVAGV